MLRFCLLFKYFLCVVFLGVCYCLFRFLLLFFFMFFFFSLSFSLFNCLFFQVFKCLSCSLVVEFGFGDRALVLRFYVPLLAFVTLPRPTCLLFSCDSRAYLCL